MGRAKPKTEPISPEQLRHWGLLAEFKETVHKVLGSAQLNRSFSDSKRLLEAADYLSLFLFGLINPVVRTMRGLCQASQLERVQKEVCRRSVSLGSFSETQHLLDPELLEQIFLDLGNQIPKVAQDPRLQKWQWLARDGSLFRALPRMKWALYGGGRKGAPNRAARLHLSFHVFDRVPKQAAVRAGRDCERAVWREQWEEGYAYVGDRYFGENYQLFGQLEQAGCAYVIRLLETAAIHPEQELPVGEADRKAGVVRQAWARLGKHSISVRLRVVWIQTQDGKELILATNLDPEALSAELVGLLYRRRWEIEMYFYWVKCILGCRHWLAESEQGATIQIYLGLIAGLLIQLYTGKRPTKRIMELIQFYLMGWATPEELANRLITQREKLLKNKA